MISAVHSQSGAKSGARVDDPATLADAVGVLPAMPDSPDDPLLTRFLDAWQRLSGDDRLRLVQDAERLAYDALEAREGASRP